jgi:hypothetical protein
MRHIENWIVTDLCVNTFYTASRLDQRIIKLSRLSPTTKSANLGIMRDSLATRNARLSTLDLLNSLNLLPLYWCTRLGFGIGPTLDGWCAEQKPYRRTNQTCNLDKCWPAYPLRSTNRCQIVGEQADSLVKEKYSKGFDDELKDVCGFHKVCVVGPDSRKLTCRGVAKRRRSHRRFAK